MPDFTFPTALGACTIRFTEGGLTGFALKSGDEPDPAAPPGWVESLARRVQNHLDGRSEDFVDAPFAWSAVGAFQRAIYTAALEVKAGQTISYGALARRAGYPVSASRAVGVALGQNPWPLLVPCHRFVGSRGHMTGFSAPGGIQTKLRLLAIEGAELFADV